MRGKRSLRVLLLCCIYKLCYSVFHAVGTGGREAELLFLFCLREGRTSVRLPCYCISMLRKTLPEENASWTGTQRCWFQKHLRCSEELKETSSANGSHLFCAHIPALWAKQTPRIFPNRDAGFLYAGGLCW